MSGHSKWANIKNRKGAQDKKRSEAFTKMAKNILTAVRLGGGNTNPEANIQLKAAIEKAKSVNMPKENIERLLKNFEDKKANLANYVFEGFGPCGVPFIVEAESDNKNRTLSEIKFMFKENDGTLGESGSVAYMFEKFGEVELASVPEEKQLELIDAGAQDFDENTVYVAPEQLHAFLEKIKEMGLETVSYGIVMKAKAPVQLQSEDEVAKVLDLVDSLEESDDVINVFTGFSYAAETV
ncbi:MAG TPA: YebC/PmpR family DNA-binding transcriptional regulator [Patescibacteria group bacterium]